MFTSILIYYGLCAVGLVGGAKVIEHIADNDTSSSSGTNDYSSSSYDDNLGFDGEPNGMPYMP